MSLFEPTENGLLGTHVTWNDVEQAMQNALKTEACFGVYKKVSNLGEMKGFLSRIALIEPDWVGSNINSTKLPEKFAVKIASQLSLVEIARMTRNTSLETEKIPKMAQMTQILHNREIEVYRILDKESNPRILHPNMYAFKHLKIEKSLKAFIIFQYIPHVPIAMHQPIPVADLIPVLGAAAAFSALGEKLPDDELSFVGGTNFWEEVLKDLKDEKSVERTSNLLRSILGEDHKVLCERMLEIYGIFYTKWVPAEKLSSISKFIGHKPVLGHCDLWNSNLMYAENEEGGLVFKGLIDFQTVSWCSPGMDLARLFACVLSTNDRREKSESLLEEYYKYFIEELKGIKAPYSLQQLKDSYSIFLPIMGMVILPAIAGGLQLHKDTDAANIILEKIVGLVEDVVSSYEENLKKFPTFFEI